MHSTTMRANFVPLVTIVLICLAFATGVPARPQPNLVNARHQDETPPTAFGAHQGSLNRQASERGVERRALASCSGCSTHKAPAYKPYRSKPFHWRGQPPTLWGFVIGISIVVGLLLLCCVFVVVAKKRDEDPNWRVRTFLRRKFKRTNKAGKGHRDDEEREPNVEKKLPDAEVSDAVKTPPVLAS